MATEVHAWDGITDAYVPGPDWRDRVSTKVKLHQDIADDLDPITYEVIRHALWVINSEHGETMARLSGSPSANITHDFNPVILTEHGEDVFFGPYIQHLAASCSSAVRWILENRGENPGIGLGDIFLENDPWIGCNHQPDVGTLAPVFWQGEIFCWVANTLHVYDLGGSTPGSFCPDALDVYTEPTPIPPIKIVEGGEIRRDVEEMYLRHSRAPGLVALDLRSAIAGNVMAARRITGLIERYGASVVKAVMRKIVDDGEQAFLRRIQSIPDGIWTDVGYLEEKSLGDRHAHKIVLTVEKRGDKLIFGNEGTADQMDGSLNCTLIGWRGAITAALMPVFTHDQLFAIGGALRHCEFAATPRTLTCASWPAAVSCSPTYPVVFTVAQAHRVLLKMGFSSEEIRPDLSPGGMSSWGLAALSGTDHEDNAVATVVIDEMGAGIGAFTWRDGISAGGHDWIPLGIQPNIENNEYSFPILYLYRKLVRDSGGAGRFRGGNTFASCYVMHKAKNLTMHTISTGQGIPTGLGGFGGSPGIQNRHLMVRSSDVRAQLDAGRIPQDISAVQGRPVNIPGKSVDNALGEDDVYEQRPNSPAGYGDPLDREPWRVLADVGADEVTIDGARVLYGVVLTPDGSAVDDSATEALRQKIRSKRAEGAQVWAAESAWTSGSGIATSGDGLRIHEYLTLANDRIVCTKCGHDYCDRSSNYKWYAQHKNVPIASLGPDYNEPSVFVDDELLLRQYFCPACLTLVETEFNTEDGEPIHDLQIARDPTAQEAITRASRGMTSVRG